MIGSQHNEYTKQKFYHHRSLIWWWRIIWLKYKKRLFVLSDPRPYTPQFTKYDIVWCRKRETRRLWNLDNYHFLSPVILHCRRSCDIVREQNFKMGSNREALYLDTIAVEFRNPGDLALFKIGN